jgi:hypothetical protein
MNTICNPVNLSYRFQLEGIGKVSCREAADPSVVFFEDEYWLFASKSGGYWHSPDLKRWSFVASSVLPVEDYAPDAEVIDGWIVVTASRRGESCPVYRTRRPAEDQWELVGEVPEHHDPAYFQDENGRVYLYWGCSNHLPLYVREADGQSLVPEGPTLEIHEGDPERFGWEIRGENHDMPDKAPHIEGPWMTRHEGRYYLQYAAPGTQYNVYSDAVLVGDSPLGPFAPQASNPLSYKPGGFMPGAGHGCTFADRYGNWWHCSTMRVSVRHKFERRLGLWPAGFDEDGVMFCNTAFGDYPMRLPEGPWDPWKDPFAGWMLLSFRAEAEASSSLSGHEPQWAFDEDCRTYWAGQGDEATLTADLGRDCSVRAVQVNFCEHEAQQHGRQGQDLVYRYVLEASGDKENWQVLVDKSQGGEDLPHDTSVLEQEAEVRYVRLRILHVASGRPAVSGLRVFGLAECPPPGHVQGLTAKRDQDRRRAKLTWSPVEGAIGYQVRWGIRPDKLYHCCMVYEAAQLELACLGRDVPEYFAAVEALGPGGVGPLSAAVEMR